MEVCSGRIVEYSISDRMQSSLDVVALDSAVARRRADGAGVARCIVATDRGPQFRGRKFVHTIHRHGLAWSMGRVDATGGHTAMESFFALLQKNILNRQT